MDEFIELMVYFLTDWQQTAIVNTRYSVVLIALSILIGGLFVFVWKRKSIATLKDQLLQGKQTLEQAEKKQAELLSDHKKNTEQRVELEQQIEQLNVKNQQENEAFQLKFTKKVEQFNKELQNKQIEFNGLESTLNDKTELTKQLQSKLSQYAVDQKKMVAIEKERKQLSNEFDVVKQQLAQMEQQLTDKKIQIEQLEKAGLSDKSNKEQGLQQEDSSTHQSEGMQEQLVQLESKVIELEQDKLTAESKAEYSVELENIIQQQNQQLIQYNEKLILILKDPQTVTQEDSIAVDNKDGFVNKLLNMISVLDNVDISNKKQKDHEGSSISSSETEDVWQKHKLIIDQLIERLATDPIMDMPESNNQPTNENNVDTIDIEAEELPAEISEQSNESTEKIDNFQDKLKGFYQKISLMVPKN